MKIKEYSSNELKYYRKPPAISIHQNGLINLSKTLCKSIGIKEGTKVGIGVNPDNETDWFLILNAPDGFPVYRISKQRENIGFFSKGIVDMVTEKLGMYFERSVYMTVSTEPVKENLYPIITRGAQVRGEKRKS